MVDIQNGQSNGVSRAVVLLLATYMMSLVVGGAQPRGICLFFLWKGKKRLRWVNPWRWKWSEWSFRHIFTSGGEKKLLISHAPWNWDRWGWPENWHHDQTRETIPELLYYPLPPSFLPSRRMYHTPTPTNTHKSVCFALPPKRIEKKRTQHKSIQRDDTPRIACSIFLVFLIAWVVVGLLVLSYYLVNYLPIYSFLYHVHNLPLTYLF